MRASKGLARRSVKLLPRATAFCWSSSAPTREAESLRRRLALAEAARNYPRRGPTCRIYTQAEASAGVVRARVRAGRAAACARQSTKAGRAGRTPPSRPRSWARICARSTAMAEYGYSSPMYGHFGQGCVHMRINFDFRTADAASPTIARSSTARRTWSSRSAARSPASTATARRAARCWRRCSAPELMEAFREFKALWDPTDRMNPGKVIGTADAPVMQPQDNLRFNVAHPPMADARRTSLRRRSRLA